MRLDYLRYFEHLAEVLNYTRAAEDLFIAQPTLSVAIKRMEQELGFQLLRRSEGSSKVELTEMGEVMHEYVSLALKNYDTGLRIARERQGELNSSLRIGTIYAMQGRFWSQAMSDFRATCKTEPKVTIEQAYSTELVDRVRRGDLDVAFASRVEGDSGLNHVLVWSQPLVLGVNREHPLAKRSSVSLDELKKYEILSYAPTSPVSGALSAVLPLADMNIKLEYDDEITLSALVSANKQTMALFCYSFLVEAFEDVVCLPIAGIPSDFHKIYLFSRRDTHPKIVDDYLAFMGSYRFPNIRDLQAERLS